MSISIKVTLKFALQVLAKSLFMSLIHPHFVNDFQDVIMKVNSSVGTVTQLSNNRVETLHEQSFVHVKVFDEEST